ncbi:MAG: hypothetical protein LC739_14290, partial [Actinobacteria bacterium]|nr:hypothetical protein [Actinomycetota bacterium]
MFDTLEAVESTAPGADLAFELEKLDRESLSGEKLVGLMKARSRLIAHLQAEFYADVKAVADAV